MDKIIEEVNTVTRGYRMGDNEIKIVCYADDIVIMAENEDHRTTIALQVPTNGRDIQKKPVH